MFAIRFLIFLAVAIACTFAAEERVKKDVLLGAAPYAYSAPIAYSGYAAPAYAAPAYAYSSYAAPAYAARAYAAPAYAGYAGYPYSAGLYRSAYYY
ncbi:Hypothetical protein NTJ_08212 [Nesidiocoris tenuis]|uniref:Uncharacterized protein n=1 Tax=Nesidiocoris tenuis TaxID=355587 RepID=A0ABN7AVT1_9HEMI|nr:Hypothetical protein NTJ_08212 [Nesidiocoris tenuis]